MYWWDSARASPSRSDAKATHGSGSSGVLSGTTSDVVDLGVGDNVVVATVSYGPVFKSTYIGMCFSSAKMASFDFKPYFSRY